MHIRKNFFAAFLLFLASQAAVAQSTYETALEAKEGENTATIDIPAGESAGIVYWKYTANEDCALVINTTLDSNSAPTVTTLDVDADGNQTIVTLRGASDYPKQTFSILKGETYYFEIAGQGEVGWNLAKTTMPGIGTGLTEDKPLEIVLGETQFLGDVRQSATYDAYTMYAHYTAVEDGLITMASSYVSLFTVNGAVSTYDGYDANGKCQYKFDVKAGNSYDIQVSNYCPVVFTATLSHPVEGELDTPFSLVEGENKVPAAAGTYYYSLLPSKTGILSITSNDALTGGQLNVYMTKDNVKRNAVATSSSVGSYDVRLEITFANYFTYYVEVVKPEATDAEQTFNFTIEDYQPGEKESNPIVISTLPSDVITLPQAKGVYYYQVAVPKGTQKFLAARATSKIEDASTRVTIYQQSMGYYLGSTGNDYARADVSSASASADVNYIIRWSSGETTPISFTVSYEDIAEGDLATQPKKAVLGENTVSGDGDKYYTYTATQDGKLSVTTATDAQSVTFMRGTSAYDGIYTTLHDGNSYAIEATAETTYLFKLTGMKDADVFTVSETQFAEGEVAATAIELLNDTSYFNDIRHDGVWYKYVVRKAGVVTIYSNTAYSTDNTLTWRTASETTESEFVSGEYDYTEGTYKYTYTATRSVSEGEVLYIYIDAKAATPSDYLALSIEGYKKGQTIDDPIILKTEQTVTIPEASYDIPIWCKFTTQGGVVKLSASDYIGGYWYLGYDNAKADVDGQYFGLEYTYDPTTYDFIGYSWMGDDMPAGEIYLMFTNNYSDVELTLDVNGDEITAIDHTTAAGGPTTSAVYTLNGQKVGETTDSSLSKLHLATGIYIVRQGGKAQKVVVK